MKINNLEWQIKTTTDFNEDLFGRTDYDTLTIYISAKTCEQTQQVTLIHELIHAFLHSYGFMYKDNFTREDICEFVAHNLDAICELYWNAKQELDKAKGH
jgi:Zn-dependent peptidase ImmA (M78 family)